VNSDWRPSRADIPPTAEAIEEWLKSQMRRIPAIGTGLSQDLTILPFSGGILSLGNYEENGARAAEIEWMGPRTDEQIIRALRDDLGITASKEHRDVEFLIVRPRLQ
jgi:hypothetical protein